VKEAKAFAPGHVTGFFQICDAPDDPILKGSRGSGVSIVQGVHTRVIVEPAERTSYKIIINGKLTRGAYVSENVLQKFMLIRREPLRIDVQHTVETPMGAGFGSSGGGALSLALALNEVLGAGLSRIEAAKIAHVAEIECKTGLGTVFADLVGGFGVLVKPGGPGIGQAIKYNGSEKLSVVYVHFGSIETRTVLSNEAIRGRINELGGGFVDQICSDLGPELFMVLARKFTNHVGLATPRLSRVFRAADDAKIPCAMAMFGEVAFSLVYRNEAEEVAKVFEAAVPGYETVIAGVDNESAKLVE
jgi:pantoate kinase